MERLTAYDGNYYYPHCMRGSTCDGRGPSEKCKEYEFDDRICVTIGKYEDTGLTPQEIMKLKERDTEKAPEIHENKRSSVYTCPSCNLVLINKDEKGWFCGKHYKFCPDCGQRLKWED